ncbi:MAG: arginine deiminase family protein [Pseudomonadota bacterium]
MNRQKGNLALLHIYDETSPLKDLCVCKGTAVPAFETFENSHEEFTKFPMLRWDRDKLLRQQEEFYVLMDRYGVRLRFVPHSAEHPWQMYTRDTGFVIHDKLYFSNIRELPERTDEIDLVRRCISGVTDADVIDIKSGRIEGGDVLVDNDTVYVGLGTRTTPEAVEELSRHVDVTPVHLGPRVMHLDTRMTILPGRIALVCQTAFKPEDLEMLRSRFALIEVTDAEARAMGTNVFVIDPETVVVHVGFERIADELRSKGLKLELLDYSEPNALLGSFRCATMPLARS